MSTLTQFIQKKLNSTRKNDNLNKNDLFPLENQCFFQKPQNLSSKSIGLSTLLDLQNEEQFLQGIKVSKINQKYKNTTQSKVTFRQQGQKYVKNDIEQMRQKRRLLQTKITKTLNKAQNRKKICVINDKRVDASKQQIAKRKQYSINSESSNNLQKCQQQFSKSRNLNSQLNDSQTSIHLKSSSYKSRSDKSFYQYQSYQKHSNLCAQQQQFHDRISQSSKQSSQILKQDPFLRYLFKEMTLLKCQKFVKNILNFKFKWLLRRFNVIIDIQKITSIQEINLQRFVFIEWKRCIKQEGRKLQMIKMIKNRIEEKKVEKQQQMKIENNRLTQSTNKSQNKFQNFLTKRLNGFCSKRNQQPIIPTNIHSKAVNLAQSNILIMNTNYSEINEYILKNVEKSQLNLQEISPIKFKALYNDKKDLSKQFAQCNFPQEDQIRLADYSCITNHDEIQ